MKYSRRSHDFTTLCLAKYSSYPELPIHEQVKQRVRRASAPVLRGVVSVPTSPGSRKLKRRSLAVVAVGDVATATSSSDSRSADRLLDEDDRPGVERPHNISVSASTSPKMTATRSVKASRRQLIVDLHDDDLSVDRKAGSPPSSPPSSPRHSPIRTLRRTKNLRLAGQPTEEPIAISLTLASPPSPKSLPMIPLVSNTPVQQDYHDQQQSESVSESPAPPSAQHERAASPVRLGTAARPYYSAIRKQGISPPSSRRTSVTNHSLIPIPQSIPTPSTPSSPRPQSYTPPSHLVPPPALSASAARHLSMSAVLPSSSLSASLMSGSAYSSHNAASASGIVSVFALDDSDSDDADADDTDLPVPPTPGLPPERERLSFAKRLSRRKSNTPTPFLIPPPTTLTSTANHSSSAYAGTAGFKTSHHNHSQSLSYAYHSPLMNAPPPASVSAKAKGYRMSTPAAGFSGFGGFGGFGAGVGAGVGEGESVRGTARPSTAALGVGFSMSGETELRMALSAMAAEADGETGGRSNSRERGRASYSRPSIDSVRGATSAGVAEDGFRFRETPGVAAHPPSAFHFSAYGDAPAPASARPYAPPISHSSSSGAGPSRGGGGRGQMDLASRNSFMGRVKKLRKGLKDMLLMSAAPTDGGDAPRPTGYP